MNQIHTTELKTTETSLNEHHVAPSPKGETLRRWWWLILLIAIAAAGATYGVSKAVSPKFSSSGSVAVNVTGGPDPSQTATAANTLASQYAQDVTAQTVIAHAIGALAPSDARGLTSAVSGGTVAGQNVVQVTAVGSSAGQAQRRASAMLDALSAYVARSVAARSSAYSKAVAQQLAPIDHEIRTISDEISHAPASELNTGRYLALQQTLSTLIAQRSASIVNTAQSATGGQPSLSTLTAASTGSQTAPRPTLYTAVAFLVALLVATQAVMYLAPRRS
jgi:capsular polysaccharide biosynthesis protein